MYNFLNVTIISPFASWWVVADYHDLANLSTVRDDVENSSETQIEYFYICDPYHKTSHVSSMSIFVAIVYNSWYGFKMIDFAFVPSKDVRKDHVP